MAGTSITTETQHQTIEADYRQGRLSDNQCAGGDMLRVAVDNEGVRWNAERWLMIIAEYQQLRPNTITIYTAEIMRMIDWLERQGVRSLPRIRPILLTSYLSERDRGLAASSKQQHRAIIHNFFRFCHEEGLIQTNPARNLPRVKAPRARVNAASQGQIRKILDAATVSGKPWTRKRNIALVNLLYLAGLRNQEAGRMRWSDIGGGVVRVTAGKGGKYREIPVCGALLQALRDWKAVAPKSDLVFPGSGNQGISGPRVWRIVSDLAKYADVGPLHPHQLRHAFGTMMTRQGVDPFTLADMMGHSNIQTTQIYVDANHESALDALNRMGEEL